MNDMTVTAPYFESPLPFFDEAGQVVDIEQDTANDTMESLGLKDIFSLSETALQLDHWIIDGLIERGDQVLLAGAPKTGKSLLASQIALAASGAGSVIGWRAPIRQKVLYVNLEIKEKWLARRVNRQIGKDDDNTRLQYMNFYSYSLSSGLDIMTERDMSALARRIKLLSPDLIVFDVFSRLHNENEVEPKAMKNVLLKFRDLANGAAHIIVIHTRKQDKGGGPQLASDIKGSVAIFGECDAAIVLSKYIEPGAVNSKISLHVEARNVAGAFKNLEFDVPTLTFIDEKNVTVPVVVASVEVVNEKW
ncbi:MAG: AAA family ATPase [Burkholderiales bacterium]